MDAAEQDAQSVLHFYRKLLRLRTNSRTLIYGDFALIEREHPQVFGYTRSLDGETYTILCNMSAETAVLSNSYVGECLLRNVSGDMQPDRLAPFEARVIRTEIR